MLVAAAGVLALVLIANPMAVVTGMAVFGAGFGVAQNASLALMLQHADASAYGTVSALPRLRRRLGRRRCRLRPGGRATGYAYYLAATRPEV